MAALAKTPPCTDRATLRAWLTYVVETAIDWLDELDAADTDIEVDDDFEIIEVVRVRARRA